MSLLLSHLFGQVVGQVDDFPYSPMIPRKPHTFGHILALFIASQT
jgi:hypothetical protein